MFATYLGNGKVAWPLEGKVGRWYGNGTYELSPQAKEDGWELVYESLGRPSWKLGTLGEMRKVQEELK